MADMDFVAWVNRAKAFVRGMASLPGKIVLCDNVEPPAIDEHSSSWLNSKQCSLPGEIHRFISTASKWCSFYYRWKPTPEWGQRLESILPGVKSLLGGANLCEGNRYFLYDNRFSFRDFFGTSMFGAQSAAGTSIEEERGDLLPLTPPEDGEQLALELGPDSEFRGAVVLCRPESGARTKVSLSFEQFLRDWERICYLSPSSDMLSRWADSTGLFNPDEDKAAQLRSLLSSPPDEPGGMPH
jgi:hypothetical protein